MRWMRQVARGVRLLRRQGPAAFVRMALHQGRRVVARRISRHDFLRDLPNLGDLVGMTTPEEQSWLHRYASRTYSGSGAIVDLGCWLGSSAIALAQGLESNPAIEDRALRIHAYDLFVWEEWMEDSVAGTALAGAMRPGQSFLPEFERRVAPWRDLVATHPGDLHELGWSGGPIELLFNDAAKSWSLANAVVRDFHPALEPGVSRVVEQDFCHYFTPWVHLICHRLGDAIEPEVYIPYSGSMVFRYVQRPKTALPTDLGFTDFSQEEVETAFERSLSLVDRPMRPNVWAARVMWEVHQGKLDEARRLFAEAPRRGFRGLDLEKVRPLLDG